MMLNEFRNNPPTGFSCACIDRNCRLACSLVVMERIFLSLICSSIVLLVAAFALATPPIATQDGPPEQTLLSRATQR